MNCFDRIVLEKLATEQPSSEDFFGVHPWGKAYAGVAVSLARLELEKKIKERIVGLKKDLESHSYREQKTVIQVSINELDKLLCFLQEKEGEAKKESKIRAVF